MQPTNRRLRHGLSKDQIGGALGHTGIRDEVIWGPESGTVAKWAETKIQAEANSWAKRGWGTSEGAVGKILRWPPSPSLPLPLATPLYPQYTLCIVGHLVGRICEYGGMIIPWIRLYHTRFCHSRLEWDSPASFAVYRCWKRSPANSQQENENLNPQL